MSNRFLVRAAVAVASAVSVTTMTLSPGDALARDDSTPLIEEIIVEGQKREQPLDDVASSVVVYTDDLIEALTFTDLADLYQFTPNVQNTVGDEGEFSIRGIGFRGQNLSESGNLASLYIDGIFQSNLGIEAGPASVFDISQIEIYRGPQSTIQGRNALAGAIHVRTQDPTWTWTGRARVEFAEFGTERYAAAFGGPILEDELAFRLAVDDYRSDGFLTSTAIGSDEINRDESRTVRAKLLYEPAALEGFSALLTYVSGDGFAGTGFGTSVAEGPDYFARQNTFANPTLLDIDTENWALTLTQALSPSLSLEWVTTYSDAEEDGAPRFEFDPAAGFDLSFDGEQVRTSDLRIVRDGDRLSGVAGLYYFERERERVRDLFFPFPNSPTGEVYFIQNTNAETENVAAYFDGEFLFSDRLALLFGVRYDDESFEEAGAQALAFALPFPDLTPNSSDTSFDAFLPRVGLRYDVNPDQTWTFTVQRGYRAGGAAIDGNNDAYEYDPEYTINYELGLRLRMLDGRFALNANAFYVDWEDQQVLQLDPTGVLARIANAGESTLYGLEVDFTARLTEALSVFGGVGLLKTQFDEYTDDNLGDLSGNRFGQAPEESLAVGLNYRHPSGFFATVDGSYNGDTPSDAANLPENWLDSYTLVNGKIGYAAESWHAAVFARNLLDEDYLIRLDVDRGVSGEANVGAPRVVGAEFTVNF